MDEFDESKLMDIGRELYSYMTSESADRTPVDYAPPFSVCARIQQQKDVLADLNEQITYYTLMIPILEEMHRGIKQDGMLM